MNSDLFLRYMYSKAESPMSRLCNENVLSP